MTPEDACLKSRDEQICSAAEHIEHAQRLEAMRLEILIARELVR